MGCTKLCTQAFDTLAIRYDYSVTFVYEALSDRRTDPPRPTCHQNNATARLAGRSFMFGFGYARNLGMGMTRLVERRPSTINRNAGASDIACLFRGKKTYYRGHFVRPTHAS